jgi:gamma-glutamylcyclotransferase (GGCT)/AIG2-like uncharacterized protein YtfP
MRLFVYGTLLHAGTLASRGGHINLPARMLPAGLPGWRRVALRGGRYPTLRRQRAGIVRGAVVTVPARALARLAAYEGPAYRLTRVVVVTPNGKTAVHAWIAPGGTRSLWEE